MKKYKIRIIKKYTFTLDGEDRNDINNQVNTIMNESNILALPYVRKNVRVKIKELRSEEGLNEKNN